MDNNAATSEIDAHDFFSSLSLTQKSVVRHISYYARMQWGYCQKTYKTIAKECGCSIATVKRIMSYMKSAGLATIRRMGRNPSQITVTEELIRVFNKRANEEPTKPHTIYIKGKNINRANNSQECDLTEEKLATISDLDGLNLTLNSKLTIANEVERLSTPRDELLVAKRATIEAMSKFPDNGKSGAFNAGGYLMKSLRNNINYLVWKLKRQNDEHLVRERNKRIEEEQAGRTGMPDNLKSMLKQMRGC